MAEDMQLGLHFHHSLKQRFAAAVHLVVVFVQNSEGRTMGYQNVSVLGHHFPQLLPFPLLVHEAPVAELGRIGRPEYGESFDFDGLML